MMMKESWKQKWDHSNPIKRIGVVVLVVAVLIVIVAVVIKQVSMARETRARKNDVQAGPRVNVVAVVPSAPQRLLTLLGEARPYETVTLYSKVSGYLSDVRVDKGDSVEAGERLAVVASPESTQDYEAALADAKNKRGIAERVRPLLDKKLVSQQEADQSFADADMAEARARSLGATRGYQDILAPFSGMVTARFADPGTLIQNAENAQSGAQPLFTVSQVNRLRIYCYVDQRDASYIRRGIPVVVGLQDRPDIKINAKISRFSGELDTKTRMLLAEVDVDNKDGPLFAGSFVQVVLTVNAASYLQVPVEALVLKQTKNFIPVVTSSHTIDYREVSLADNDGQSIKVLSGLQKGEWVALNLGNSVEQGSPVQPVFPSTATAPGTPAAGGSSSSSGPSASSSAASSSSSGNSSPPYTAAISTPFASGNKTDSSSASK